MYQTLIVYHSIIRWLLLAALLYALLRAWKGYRSRTAFSKADNAVRHWTATVAHIQLVIGMILYTQSPVVRYFWKHFREAAGTMDTLFFGLLHILLMLSAIVMITVGSALAKRRNTDQDKFRTMLIWYTAALCIIIIAIPWPFSPFAQRPYWR